MATQFVLVVVLLAAVVTGAALWRRTPPSVDRGVAGARTHARYGALLAPVVGVMAAVGAGTTGLGDAVGPGDLGVTALLVPIAYGVGALVVLLVAELTWPRPGGRVRAAGLAHRGVGDAAPAWLVRAAAFAAAGAVVVLVGGTSLADDSGRAYTVVGDGVGGHASPFPGATYAGPAALGLAVVWVLALVGLRVVADRPAVTLDDPATEVALRRASAHRLLRTAVGTTALVAGGLLAVGGRAVRSVAFSVGDPGGVGTAVALLGLGAALAGVVVLCLPAPRLPAPVSAGAP